MKALLDEHGPAAIEKMAHLMQTSKDERIQLEAAKALADRKYGKAPQAVALTGPGGGDLKINLVQFSRSRP